MTARDRTQTPDEYVEAAVHRLLTENADIAEQGIKVVRRDHSLVLYGEVESDKRRDEITRLLSREFPDIPLTVDIGLIRTQAPSDVEDLP